MLTIYRSLVRNRISTRERGLTVVALSRLTWSAEDQRAWDDAYLAALLLGVGRELVAWHDCCKARGLHRLSCSYPSAAAGVMERDA